MIVLADKGMAGRELQRYAAEEVKILLVLGPHGRAAPGTGTWAASGNGSSRSTTTVKYQLSLERRGGRTHAGVLARIAQRLLALAACIWHNWSVKTTGLRSLAGYDH